MSERRRSSVILVDHGNDGRLRLDDATVRKMSVTNPDLFSEFEEAKKATDSEHSLSVSDSLKLYRKAIMFSLVLSTAVIMEGYDLSLMGSFLGFTPFEERYVVCDQYEFLLIECSDMVLKLLKMEVESSLLLGSQVFRTVSKLGPS